VRFTRQGAIQIDVYLYVYKANEVMECVNCAETDEDLLLKQALEMSMQPTASDDEQTSAPSIATRDFSTMSEDEQVAYAMQMSMDPTSGGLFVSLTCCFKRNFASVIVIIMFIMS